MNYFSKALLIYIFILGFSACVPISKFNDVQKKSSACIEENAKYKADNEKLQVSNKELNAQVELLTGEKDKLLKDSVVQYARVKQLQTDFNKLESSYNDLQTSQENTARGNAHENNKLLTQLQTTQLDLQKREDQLRKLEGSLNDKKVKLELLTAELDKRNERMKDLESILNRKDSAVAALKTKVSAALMGFENNGLTIKIKNGKVYVSLEEKLLFKSGSATVDQGGINALRKLVRVLEQNKDINIMIEGHTDDVPYHTDATTKDNWDLSVRRATSIVRILLDNTTIAPIRLTASGRGEFVPIDRTKSAQARQKNRRTEIILTPKLDELFKILENNN